MKTSLRTKLILILVVSGILPLILALVLAETLGYRHLLAEQGARYRSEAAHLVHTLRVAVAEDIDNLSDLVVLGNVARLVAETQSPDLLQSPASLRPATEALDARWASLPPNAPELQSILKNALSDQLRAIQSADPLFRELLIADRAGRLIAATNKTSDYDQSDEAWWERAMRLKAGEAVLDGLDIDQSSGVFSLNMAVPIFRPGTTNDVIGAMKVVIDAKPLFATVPVFASDLKTMGEIVRPNGRILLGLSHEDLTPDDKVITEEAAAHFQNDRSGWFVAPLKNGEISMVGYAPFFLLGAHTWDRKVDGPPFYVIVHSPAQEVITPLRQRLTWIMIAGTIVVLICTGVGGFLSQQDIVTPVNTLRRAASALTASAGPRTGHALGEDPDKALAEVGRIKTGDEVEALSRDFSTMAGRLLCYQRDLRSEIALKTAEIQRDLEMARDFQQALLPRKYPRVPTRAGTDSLTLNFHHIYRAAMSVSGDFCDVIKLDDHTAGIFIADVMGHGTRSALVTAILRTLLHSLSKTAHNPAAFLGELNEHFHETMKRADQVIFVSACYLVVDTLQGEVRCASAGHPSPLLGNRTTGQVEPLFGPLRNNPALGLLDHASYEVFSRPLREADVFLLFTDGVTEALNAEDEEFGRERLERAARRHLAEDLATFTQSLLEEVLIFNGHQSLEDDICLVAVEAVSSHTGDLLISRDRPLGQKTVR